jgi:hypothetical protein
MHNKTKNNGKNVVSNAKAANDINNAKAANDINNANAATLQAASANASIKNASAQTFNDEHSAAIAVNNVFNALQATNTNTSVETLMQTAQQLTTTAANVAAAAAEKAAAKAAKAVKAKKQTAAYIVFLQQLIAANAYTAHQIVAMCAQQFTTVKLSTIQTTVTDSKNAKYTRFGQTAVCNATTKILSFANASAAADDVNVN